MPTNKKNTNKTAHVLNVITAGKESGETPFTSGAPAAAPVSPSAAVFSNVVEVEHEPEELSDQIREALSQELERGETESFSAIQPESVQIRGSEPVAPTSVSAAPPAAAARPASPVCQSASPSTEGQPESSRQAANLQSSGPALEQESDESEYINVMQALVDEKTPRYIQLLGVCPCSRCQADVKALALCHLEPKYIVIRKSQKFPYSVYENYYNAAVTSQIISACQVVKENPRH